MSERRAKGLRYYCDEKFTPDHYHKHKKEDFHEARESEDTEKLENMGKDTISLNAIAGITYYTTMENELYIF